MDATLEALLGPSSCTLLMKPVLIAMCLFVKQRVLTVKELCLLHAGVTAFGPTITASPPSTSADTCIPQRLELQ